MFCKPEYLEDLIKAMAVVDVLSPNHDEAAGSFRSSSSTLFMKLEQSSLEQEH